MQRVIGIGPNSRQQVRNKIPLLRPVNAIMLVVQLVTESEVANALVPPLSAKMNLFQFRQFILQRLDSTYEGQSRNSRPSLIPRCKRTALLTSQDINVQAKLS